MPNWVINKVVIKGSEEEIARCNEQITKGGQFSLNNIVPMPDSLSVTCGPLRRIAESWSKASDEEKKEIEDKHNLTDSEKDEIRQIADNIAKYGHPTWYEWRIGKWGTKWDVDKPWYDHCGDTISMGFRTAWNTPETALLALSRQYPGLTIYVEYADEDLGFNCGIYTLCGGEIIDEESRDLEFACDMWGYDYEEILREIRGETPPHQQTTDQQ